MDQTQIPQISERAIMNKRRIHPLHISFLTDPPTVGIVLSKRTLIRRINRRLEKDGQQLRTTIPRWQGTFGRYYIIDTLLNSRVRDNVDLEELGRELDVMNRWERVEDVSSRGDR
jgi:hypothetical protein